MRESRNFVRTVIAAVLSMLVVTFAFAGTRDNQRVTAQGRIQSVHQERNGYRVELDRHGYSFWVPEHALRGRASDFRPGIVIRLGGVYRGGSVFVDVVDWESYDEYDRSTLRGAIERIDYRAEVLYVRDERTERIVRVVFDRDLRMFRFRDLHRGDFIQLRGAWLARGSQFTAYRIEDLRLR